MNIINEMIAKILETPEIINQIKKSLVNRDLAIEIDGKKFQIMSKKNDNEIDNLKTEIKDLKSKLYDLTDAIDGLISLIQVGPESQHIVEHANKLIGR